MSSHKPMCQSPGGKRGFFGPRNFPSGAESARRGDRTGVEPGGARGLLSKAHGTADLTSDLRARAETGIGTRLLRNQKRRPVAPRRSRDSKGWRAGLPAPGTPAKTKRLSLANPWLFGVVRSSVGWGYPRTTRQHCCCPRSRGPHANNVSYKLGFTGKTHRFNPCGLPFITSIHYEAAQGRRSTKILSGPLAKVKRDNARKDRFPRGQRDFALHRRADDQVQKCRNE